MVGIICFDALIIWWRVMKASSGAQRWVATKTPCGSEGSQQRHGLHAPEGWNYQEPEPRVALVIG